MGLTILVTTIAVVASVLVAAVVVVGALAAVLKLIDRLRRGRSFTAAQQLEAECYATRRAMNDAANQSWRNLID